MKINTIILALLFVNLHLRAQISFEVGYDGGGVDVGESIISCNDSGYLVTGYSSSFGNLAQGYLLKLNKFGEYEWSRDIGDQDVEKLFESIQLYDSGYLSVGFTNSIYGRGYDALAIRTNKNGDKVWVKNYGGIDWDMFYSVAKVEGGFIMVGETYSSGFGRNDGYVVKINDEGEMIWDSIFGGVENDFFKKIIRADENKFSILGVTSSFGNGKDDIYIVNIDTNGILLSYNTLGDTGDDYGNDMLMNNNGELIIIGGSNSSRDSDSLDGWLMRVAPDGTSLMENKIYGDWNPGNYNQEGIAIAKYRHSNDLILGLDFEQDGFGRNTFLLTKVTDEPVFSDVSGSSLIKYTSFNDFRMKDIDTCLDGGYIASIYSNGVFHGVSNSIYIIKVDSNNDFACGDLSDTCVNYNTDNSSVRISMEEITSLKDIPQNRFQIYPNPVNKGEYINIQVFAEELNIIQLYNSIGNIIFSEIGRVDNNLRIQVPESLSSGIYFLRLSDGKQSIMKQIIIE